MASFSALCSYYFIHPHPAPSFTMSNLGDVKSSMIGHHLTHFPFLRDIHVGVTSGTSFPMPMCTAMTVKGELRVTISFPRDTVAEEFGIKFADDLMDRLVRACA